MNIKIKGLLILLVMFFIGSSLYAQGEQQPVDANRQKAQEFENFGEYLKAAELYEKSALEEKKASVPIKSNIVTGLNQAAHYYSLAGQYKIATDKIEEALKMAGKLEREDLVADCLNRFGYFYNYLKREDVAIKYYQEALEIYGDSGHENKVTTNLNHIGNIYNSSGQYDTAIEYLERALDLGRKHNLEGKVATVLGDIGRVYESIGKYTIAIEHYKEALSIGRKLELEEEISNQLNNIGNIYKSWGQYITAAKYYEESLEICRKLWRQDSVVFLSRLKEIGDACRALGQCEKAIKHYNEALDIYRDLEQSDNVVACLNNIGSVYLDQSKHEKAVKYFKDALGVIRTPGQDDNSSISLNNIGNVYGSLGQYDKAIEYYEKALDVDRKLKEEAEEVLTSRNLDLYYRFYWNKHDKIIYPYERDMANNKKIRKDIDLSRNLNRIGIASILQEEYKTAIDRLKESVSIIEELRKTETGEIRKRLLNDLLYSYQLLASAYIKDNDAPSAFQTIELTRAKLQIEWFTSSESEKDRKKKEKRIWLQEVEEIQETLDDDTAIIVYANINLEKIVQIAIAKRGITGKEVSRKSFVQSSIGKYEAQIKTLLINLHKLSNNKNDFNNIINYYGSLLSAPPLQGRRGRETDTDRFSETKEIGGALYELLIKPIEEQVKDKKNLIIIPDGILAFVPFGTLIDEDGRYLVEKYNISYIQSVDVRKLIRKRKYEEDRKPLLAFGGAIYEDSDFKAETIENRVQLAVLTKNIHSNLENIQMDLLMRNLYPDFENVRSVGNAYNVLGISSWPDLPETLKEVHQIKSVINKSNIFTGKNVTEKDIIELSKNWKFNEYEALHFATHGLIVPEVPKLSALVLSQFKEMGKEDGYLRTEEIAKMEIKADLVNLTAFDAGLGGIYENDGFTRLIHSFILSGTKAVSVSLWRVANESTSKFMVTMYSLVQDKGMSYLDATTEVKRQFLNGDFGEEYKTPYYWAPFVYYGN
ncbi:MAG: CHAT domain-containing tetratricopeptide repeat protein [Candidatus Scalindua sp.]|nr:CHAT domain-containing protein [Candidatus Scalindua sp.]MDV5165815.1 CHAT domain-containing tetratricopeptide repeat protein [Candidatus Scalindua sp.]